MLAAAGEGAAVTGKAGPQWYLVPPDDLAAFEAMEYAFIRINEMRRDCSGFHLAPLQQLNYQTVQVFLKDYGLYTVFRLHLEAKSNLAPGEIRVEVARQHSVTDLSLFQVTSVKPSPCDLYSELDDAELLVAQGNPMAQQAKDAAISLLNAERKILCPQRPPLQFIRTISASVQPAEGRVVRMDMELREASTSFTTNSFTDIVAVVYTLDRNIPSECTVSPAIYPSRPPCRMKYVEEEESATATKPDAEGGRRLLGNSSSAFAIPAGKYKIPCPKQEVGEGEPAGDDVEHQLVNISSEGWGSLQQSRGRGRRLVGKTHTDWATPPAVKQFRDQALEIPENFDPRLERTLCFPRGFSRLQGSCGASWAFVATAVAAFRECLYLLHQGHSNAGLHFFSAQSLVSCVFDDGCAGGSAVSAFYRLKLDGAPREECSPYRMRCFVDDTMISVAAADSETSTPKSKSFHPTGEDCPLSLDPATAPCKCLPRVYHLTKPVECRLLPNACPITKVPHYFFIEGTAAGNTVPQLERQMMQELLTLGPLYVSMLVYDDFFDPVCWTESGIYIHRSGKLIGKHAQTLVGWGTDTEGRDYWLLLNSYGNGWQQEGYFKVSRGETAVHMLKFGAYGVDWRKPDRDESKPGIMDVEVAFSPVIASQFTASPATSLSNVWFQVSAYTDEEAQMLVRLQGQESTITAQIKDTSYSMKHVLEIDLLKEGILGERARLEIWAVDKAENTGNYGPFTLEIPSEDTFRQSQMRRLSAHDLQIPDYAVFV